MSKYEKLWHLEGAYRWMGAAKMFGDKAPQSVMNLLGAISSRRLQMGRWRRFGLWRDDLLLEEHEVTQMALKRIPKDHLHARYQRFRVALHTSYLRRVLPESQWVTDAEDKAYLFPFVQQVLSEEAEKERYDSDIWSRQKQQ